MEAEREGIRMQISEFLSSNTVQIKVEDSKTSVRVYKKLLRIFNGANDTRIQGKVVYKLGEIILMMFLATLSGSDTSSEMEHFWKSNPKIYKKIFKKESIPSHDTFRRIMGLIDPADMNRLIIKVVSCADKTLRKALNLPSPTSRHICIDGKQLRGTGRHESSKGEIKDLQILNVYDNGSETCIYSEAIDSKTNEIPHAQKILSGMNLKDTVVTFDAMHTQVKTINIIAERGGDYVGGLKGNQGDLNKLASTIFTEDRLKTIEESGENFYKTSEIARNKLEVRSFFMYPLTSSLKKTMFGEWKKAYSLVCCRKYMRHNVTGKETSETRYYLSSIKDVNDASSAIRSHWGVEDSLHWSLDTVFYEDMLGVTDRTAALNKSIMNKMCLALYARIQPLKAHGKDNKEKPSKRILRKCFGWNFTDMMKETLAMFDIETLESILTITPKK